MKRGALLLLLGALLLAARSGDAARLTRLDLETGDDAPLSLYVVEGDEPGPRVLILGGVHGDEPGGLLAADMILDHVGVRRGSLVVVPRANLHSIVRAERGARGDMNRRFAGDDSGTGPDAWVVDLLKSRLGAVDALLNLHDGSGFYAPERVDASRNPERFGQSIVIDADSWEGPRGVIRLGEIASRAVERVNGSIPEDPWRFHVNNTRTGDADTIHPQMRASATWYALRRHGIPAFGVETSKDLPEVGIRVRHQFLAITALLEELGVELEIPPPGGDRPALDFAIVRLGGGEPRIVLPGDTIRARPGERLEIVSARADRPRGVTADVPGAGGWNDLGREVTVGEAGDIVFRRDSVECGRVRLEIDSGAAPPRRRAPERPEIAALPARINGRPVLVPRDSVLEVVAGDRISFPAPAPRTTVRIHGFPGGRAGDSRDDTGYTVDTGSDLLGAYSVNAGGEYYRVDAVSAPGDELLASVFLRVLPVEIASLAIDVGGRRVEAAPASVTEVTRGSSLVIQDVRSNIEGNEGVTVNLKGFRGRPDGEDRGMPVRTAEDLDPRWALDPDRRVFEIVVSRDERPVARFYLRLLS